MKRIATLLLSCSPASAWLLGAPVPLRAATPLASCAAPQQRHCSGNELRPRAAVPQMQAQDFYQDFVLTNEATGEVTAPDFKEKEKLYLDCLDAYYNEDGKKLLPDEKFDELKLDLDFEGSKVAAFTKDEITFIIANKRYSMGKAVMDDKTYDTLREKLRKAGSSVVIHEEARCNIEGICKSDLAIDQAKQRLLYLPGTLGAQLLLMEACFWTLGIDPILGWILSAVPAYFAGVLFTEVRAPCPLW